MPRYVLDIISDLRAHGHQAFLVGGAVRDALLGQVPKDWDVATSATPDQVETILGGRAIPTGKRFGTISVIVPVEEQPRDARQEVRDTVQKTSANVVEVTTFRSDGVYSDGRRPDMVIFSASLEEDLARRDFAINAIAYDPATGRIIDPHGGARDIARRRIACVGDPGERFREDALRMLRAVRLAAELDFDIADESKSAIKANVHLVRNVSNERIRAELDRILVSGGVRIGLELLQETGLLKEIIPELEETVGMRQGPNHIYTVWNHTIEAVARIEPILRLRLAALLHDVGKPKTFSREETGEIRFYRHEAVGKEIARGVLRRLGYPSAIIERVSSLVAYHMFLFDKTSSDRAVRKLVAKLGLDFIHDLAKLRKADREATGTMNGVGNNMAFFLQRVEEVLARGNILSVRDLAIDGDDVKQVLGIPPGPEVGRVLQNLLDIVMEDPALNERETLLSLVAGQAQGPPGSDARLSHDMRTQEA
ncbi:MAG TPA: CCA tRNA nucleotidyltransferase [Firmicutes bacterium]|nr:CCA tRNA nucleotidyltransferase [Bacillota bacterium]